MISVLLVDDQSMLWMGFRLILEAENNIEVVGEAGDGATGVSMAAALSPDVVLMDVRMPGLDGIAATAAIVATRPDARVLILTTFDLDEDVFAGLKAGASGFLLKDAPPSDLLTAIRTVAGGDAVLAPTATRRLIDQFAAVARPGRPFPGCRLGVGHAHRARARGVRPVGDGPVQSGDRRRALPVRGTVKIHVGHILAELGLRDRVQAVVLAYESGVVTPGG